MQFWIYPNSLKHVGLGFPYPLTSDDTEVLSQVCGIAIVATRRTSDPFSLRLFPLSRDTLGQSWKQWRGFPMTDQTCSSNPEQMPFSCQPLCTALMTELPCLPPPASDTRNPQRKRYPDMRRSHSKGKEIIFLSQYKLIFLLYFLPHTAQAKISMNYNTHFYCIK